MDLTLSENQFNLVYNSFSFVIASMGAALLFFLLARSRVAPQHRMAVTLSTLVVAIALYHYVRIFGSWEDAFKYVDGDYIPVKPFNEGYRYVDWLLTVPLLLAELVVVLKLTKSKTRSLIVRLTIAAVAMIALGYPGEIAAADSSTRTVWGVLSTIPFLYILYVLFVELGKSLERQSGGVKKLVDGLRYIILATWGIYPIAYMLPSLIDDEANAEVARQVMYSVGDVLAKPLFGILVLGIALAKSREDGYVEPGTTPSASDNANEPTNA
ncbi:MAG: xanthorhodopsin [Ilumatobacter sp.]|jgi:bacteriorhodopsin|nr:bacteriorhodopsin-like [Ilumatobacter sp.]NKB39689.1 xanthorhodopsin [Ilumatobacter sp.]